MSIEIYTRRVRNETLEDLALLEKSILRKRSTIEHLKTSKHGFNPRSVIERNETELLEMEERQRSFEIKLEQIDNGLYTEKIQAELDQNRERIAQKSAQTKKRKAANKVETPVPPPRPTFQRDHPRRFPSARDFDYAENQYHRDCASIPDHLLDKLRNMPNNLGYIWKDIWCFGNRAPERTDEYSLFEKRGQRMLVHVYNHQVRQYTLFEKDNTGRRTLLERRPLKSVAQGNCLGQLLDKGFSGIARSK